MGLMDVPIQRDGAAPTRLTKMGLMGCTDTARRCSTNWANEGGRSYWDVPIQRDGAAPTGPMKTDGATGTDRHSETVQHQLD
ncbi:hypothetical protein SNE40_013709 [Patella caerulea]|uniref:Uncharacterized protein n=1 Tax=Patella caerulea TaxID=87958 RepID=A0AAN8PP64_PATCE